MLAGSALVVGLASSTPGCATTAFVAWPEVTRERLVRVEHEAPIDSTPGGAEVRDEEGRVLGTTPLVHRSTHDLWLRWQERDVTAAAVPSLVLLAAEFLGVVAGLFTTSVSDAGNDALAIPLLVAGGVVTAWDGLVLLLVAEQQDVLASEARRFADALPVNREEDITLRWEDGTEMTRTLRVPDAHQQSVVRPQGDAFGDALRAWDAGQAGAAARDPDVLFQLARLYVERARAGARGASRRAASECRAFLELASPGDGRRERVERWMQELGEGR
jgi:hypothetical protein